MIRMLLAVSRPRFWAYLAGTYLVGFTAGAASPASFLQPGFWLHLLYFLLPANVLIYGINDLFDEDTDRHNPKKGAREHLLRHREKRTVVWAVIAAFAAGLVLLGAASSPWARVFMLCFLVLGVGYSMPPARLKARPGLDSASNILYAMPGLLGFVQAADALPPLVAVVGVACWTSAMHLFSAVPDIEADRAAGLATSATVLGTRGALAVCAVLWSVSCYGAWVLVGLPAAVAAAVYPAAAVAVALRPDHVARAYWYFPALNALAGFVLFVVAAAAVVA